MMQLQRPWLQGTQHDFRECWQLSWEGRQQPTRLKYMRRKARPTPWGKAQATCGDFNSSWRHQEILLPTLSPVLTLLPSSWPFFRAQSRSDKGGGQLKPLWLAKSWQANLFTFTELFHLGGSPFSSVTGTAFALKKESCWNTPFSKSSSPLPSKRIKHDMTKGFSPAHVQADTDSVNPQIAWWLFPAQLDWPKKFKRRGKDTLVL